MRMLECTALTPTFCNTKQYKGVMKIIGARHNVY